MTAQAAQDSAGLHVDGISKSFGHNLVLDHLSLEVERGKLVSLLGPSGCGKTTTLNMIAGFETPDSGVIRLDGSDITTTPPNRRDTAIVFQNYALFPHMNVARNIGYGLKVRKKSSAETSAAVGQIAELLGLAALLERYPGELSGGQQQRVSLARAIAVEPSLLLLDEPLSNLDAKLRQEIRVEIRRLQQRLSQTAVFVTHDQEEALVISDYIAVLNKGRLEQFGSPDDLWEHPETVYVADFMGVENILRVSADGNDASGGIDEQSVPQSLGQCTHIGFRPSHASLVSDDAGSTDHALFLPVSIRSKSYMGTHFRYECEVRGGNGFELKIDQHGSDPQFDPGQTASVSVPVSDLLGLRDAEGAVPTSNSAAQKNTMLTTSDEQTPAAER